MLKNSSREIPSAISHRSSSKAWCHVLRTGKDPRRTSAQIGPTTRARSVTGMHLKVPWTEIGGSSWLRSEFIPRRRLFHQPRPFNWARGAMVAEPRWRPVNELDVLNTYTFSGRTAARPSCCIFNAPSGTHTEELYEVTTNVLYVTEVDREHRVSGDLQHSPPARGSTVPETQQFRLRWQS